MSSIVYGDVPDGLLKDRLMASAKSFLAANGDTNVTVNTVMTKNDMYEVVFSSASGEGVLEITVIHDSFSVREV